MANILVFGDSIAFGDYDTEGGWVDRLKRHLLKISVSQKLEHDLKVYNLAISGATTKDILKRFKIETQPRNWESQPTIIIFAIGINDSILINGKNKVPRSVSKRNIERLIDLTNEYSDKVTIIGPTPVEESKVNPMPWSSTESWNNKHIENYNRMIAAVCEKKQVNYLDLFQIFVRKDYIKLLHDGAHPNARGHKFIFEIVRDFLKKKIL